MAKDDSDQSLDSVIKALSSLSKMNAPADVAELFAMSNSPLTKIVDLTMQRLDMLQQTQDNLAKVRITLQEKDKIRKGDLVKEMDAISTEIEEIKHFQASYKRLADYVKDTNGFEELDQKIREFDHQEVKKRGFVHSVKNFVTKIMSYCRQLVKGKELDIKDVKKAFSEEIKNIEKHTTILKGSHQEMAKKAKEFVKKEYPARVKEAQKVIKNKSGLLATLHREIKDKKKKSHVERLKESRNNADRNTGRGA